MASSRAAGFRAKCSETFHSRRNALVAPLACRCPLGDELPRVAAARRARRAQKQLICPAFGRSHGSAAGALDELRGHRVHDRFLFVRLMIVTQEVEDAVGEQEADFVDE